MGKLRLGRVEIDAWTMLSVLTPGEYKKLKTTDVPRKDLLSRMLSLDNKERVERIMIVHPNTFPVAADEAHDKKQMIFEFDENCVAHIVAPLNKPGDVAERFERLDSRENTVLQLTGDTQPSIADDTYGNGDECDIIALNDDGSGFIAAKNDYIRIVFAVYVVDIDADGKLVPREIPHEQILYRTTMLTPNSYLAIPKTRMYIRVERGSGAAQLIRNGEEKGSEFANIDEVITKYAGELRQNAEEHVNAPTVDFATCQLFIDTCTNESNDDFVTPCIFEPTHA